MPTVETVLGPVEASKLGAILSHEHVLISMGNDARNYPWRYDWDRTRKNAVHEISEAKAGGIGTLIDLTTPDLGRNVRYVRDIAAATGMHIVVATGIWRDVPRSFWERDPAETASIFIHEIQEGIEDSGIKAGAIKVANDAEGVTPEAENVLRGAARACKETGTPISTHQWAPKEVGRRQVEIFREEGAPMDRVCIGHSADSTDPDYLEELLNAGVYLSMDRYPGVPPRPEWDARNRTLKELIDRGWAHRLMVGHDYAPMPILKDQPDPEPKPTRYLFLHTTALPALREQGVSEDTIHTITHETPAHFLTAHR